MARHKRTTLRLTTRGERALALLCGLSGFVLLAIVVYSYIHLGARCGQ